MNHLVSDSSLHISVFFYMTYRYNTAINIDEGVQLVKLQIISIMMMAGLKIGMRKPGCICFICFRIL